MRSSVRSVSSVSGPDLSISSDPPTYSPSMPPAISVRTARPSARPSVRRATRRHLQFAAARAEIDRQLLRNTNGEFEPPPAVHLGSRHLHADVQGVAVRRDFEPVGLLERARLGFVDAVGGADELGRDVVAILAEHRDRAAEAVNPDSGDARLDRRRRRARNPLLDVLPAQLGSHVLEQAARARTPSRPAVPARSSGRLPCPPRRRPRSAVTLACP